MKNNDVGAGAAAAIAIATAIQAATMGNKPKDLGPAAASASRTKVVRHLATKMSPSTKMRETLTRDWSAKKRSTLKSLSALWPKTAAAAVRATAIQALARIAPEDAWMTAKWKCLRTDSS